MNQMGVFEQWGRKLDDLMERTGEVTQEGAGKTAKEAKKWGKKLSQLAEVVRKTAQEGAEKFAAETKGLKQTAKLRAEVRQLKDDIEDGLRQIGERTYELLSKKVIENESLKKLEEEVTALKEKVKEKEGQIRKLKEKEE